MNTKEQIGNPSSLRPQAAEESSPRVVAVIDIGATSVRMAIYQVIGDGELEKLESLSQAVSLGKDSFIKGKIESETIEECVRVLKIYRLKLDELGIRDPRDIHVVATSAVREAGNRLLFLDRVFIATGFEVEPFDEAELHRVTFLGIQPLLKTHPEFHAGTNIICEIGGGSTELLVVDSGNVVFSETFRMGSLRLRKTLEAMHAPQTEWHKIMVKQVQQVAERFKRSVPQLDQPNFIGMGGDLRFAVGQMYPDETLSDLLPVETAAFCEFAEFIVSLTPEEILNRYSMSLPEAESLGPALLANAHLIASIGIEKFHVSNINMRDGLVREMIQPEVWGEEFREQVIRYSMNLGRKYQIDENYAVEVARTSQMLFQQLAGEHELETRYELILYIAALLHEVGLFINQRGYHKHSLYLIRHSDFFGLGQKDILLIALVARYHRRAHPQPSHDGYASLPRIDRVTVSKLAAILRVAIAINASRQQRISGLDCEIGSEFIQINIPATDLSLEKISMQQGGQLFRETFGKQIVINEA